MRIGSLSHWVGAALLLFAPMSMQAQENPLESLDWMAGCWEQRNEGNVTIEMWTPPMGALMIGGSHTVNGDRSRMFEHLRIMRTQDGLVYTALPSGQSETDFASTAVSDTLVVFENPEHDFPTRIAYRPVGSDSIMARVSGPDENGGTQGFEIRMQRISCGG